MRAPKVFISYSHDSEEHKRWVRVLATDLRAKGVDAELDQWALAPGQDLAAYMMQGIESSDRVLLVCTDLYVQKAEVGIGGVGFERLIVTKELTQTIDTKKFIPIIRGNQTRKIPLFLGPRLYVNFNDDSTYLAKVEELLRELHSASSPPPLGPNPYSGAAPASISPARLAGPSGLGGSGSPILSDPWFVAQHLSASSGLAKLGLTGSTELRLALHDPINKSQLELLAGIRSAQIHTFGWPIGVVLENRDEYRPRPVADGIVAEIAIPKAAADARESSYDSWALRNNGDFYLLQSLFEDQRSNGELFFDTRIVRITEALMFSARLYTALGVPEEAALSLRVTHRGLAGRMLTAASRGRYITTATTIEDSSEADISETIQRIRERTVEQVLKVAEPLFLLFDFKQFDRRVYEEIVTNFVAGRVT